MGAMISTLIQTDAVRWDFAPATFARDSGRRAQKIWIGREGVSTIT